MKTGSGIQKLMGGYTDTQHANRMSMLSFFKIRKVVKDKMLRKIF
jgi:hypothetical protein